MDGFLELKKTDQWVAAAMKRTDEEKIRASFLHGLLDNATYQMIDSKVARGDVKKLYTAIIAREEHTLTNAFTLLRFTQFNSLSHLKLIQDEVLPLDTIKKSDISLWESMLTIEHCNRVRENFEPENENLGFGVLRDPFSVAQVPWCPNKFHYWLMSASIVAANMEMAIADYNLWPFPKKFITPMLDALYFVKTMKERVLFGFVLLGAMVNQFPSFDPKIPRMIMDEVLLPCMPIIEWYDVNKGAASLRGFSRLIWNGDQNPRELVKPIPTSLFDIEPELAELSNRHLYSFKFWVNLKKSNPEYLFSNITDYVALCGKLQKKMSSHQDMQEEFQLEKFLPGNQTSRQFWIGNLQENTHLAAKVFLLLLTQFPVIKVRGEIDIRKVTSNSNPEMSLFFNISLGIVNDKKIKAEIEELEKLKDIFFQYNSPIVAGESTKFSDLTIFNDFKRAFFRRHHLLASMLADQTVGTERLNAVDQFDESITFEEAAKMFKSLRETKFNRGDFLKKFESNKPVPISKRGTSAPINKLQIRIQDLMSRIVAANFRWLYEQLEPFPLWQFTQYVLPSLAATIMFKAKNEVGEKAPAMENMVKFLEALVEHCELAFEKHQENPKKLSTKLESEATFEDLNYNLTAANFKSQELDCLLDWFFLGKNRKNIFINDLYPVHESWAPNLIEMSDLSVHIREVETSNLGKLYKKNPSKMKKFLCANNAAAREAKERYEMLLQAARKAYGLPSVGTPIHGQERFTKLYEAMTILTEAGILVLFNKQHMQPEREKVKFNRANLNTCKFYYEWNRIYHQLGEVDKFTVGPKYASGLFKEYLKDVISGSIEAAFKLECSKLAKYRESNKAFVVPAGLQFSNNRYPDSVSTALDTFKVGDVESFQAAVKSLLE